jgi:S-adenosylmethionine:tRNA ribosyltransferase-isomerase
MDYQPYRYELPLDKIAQRPVEPPEAARMLVYNRRNGGIQHLRFSDFPSLVEKADTLVFNNTKVIPARMRGHLEEVGGYSVEVLLLEEVEADLWRVIGYPLKKIRRSEKLFFSADLFAEVIDSIGPHECLLRFHSTNQIGARAAIERHGSIPIPPYIRSGMSDDQDRKDYQSLFAKHDGSVAAPTASLHFSQVLLEQLTTNVGCGFEQLTLHVGAASFQPVVVGEEIRKPGYEVVRFDSEVGTRLADCRDNGGRIIAVGTTVVRALESATALRDGYVGKTSIFIEPGYTYKSIDCLVTNFHQPGTTHLLLLEALVGREALETIYASALDNGYRFLSYGDGMVVL